MQVYDRLVKLAEVYPVSGNKGGSYMTAFSDGLLEINIINVCFCLLPAPELSHAHCELPNAQAGIVTTVHGVQIIIAFAVLFVDQSYCESFCMPCKLILYAA